MKNVASTNGRSVSFYSRIGGLAVVLALLTAFFGAGQSRAGAAHGPKNPPGADDSVFETSAAYLVQFYPLWFTFHQSSSHYNRLVGPERVTSLYQTVVAINVDTIYSSAYL